MRFSLTNFGRIGLVDMNEGSLVFRDVDMPGNNAVSLRNVASGCKSMAMIIRGFRNDTIHPGDILIVDEPESNLHPEWQLSFAKFLVLLHARLDMRILLNTHSPYPIHFKKLDDVAPGREHAREVLRRGRRGMEDIRRNEVDYLPVSGSGSSTYSAKHRLFGAQGSSITVDAGATFDLKGNYDFYQHPIMLDGGTLANTGCDMSKMLSDGWASTGNVTLLADSFCYAPYRIRFTEGVIDLGGHRLTATFSSTYFHLDGEPGRFCNVSNGTLVVNATADGYFNPMGKANFTRDMRTVDLELGAPLHINYDIQVRNLTSSSTANKSAGDGKTYIYGVYTPISNYMYNFVMQDGSTLNLRDQAGAWSANPDAEMTKCNTLAFAEGACVRVDLTGRTLRNGGLRCLLGQGQGSGERRHGGFQASWRRGLSLSQGRRRLCPHGPDGPCPLIASAKHGARSW